MTVPNEPPLEEMFSAAYEELRRLASAVKRDDRNATLSATTLVNEALLKLAECSAFKRSPSCTSSASPRGPCGRSSSKPRGAGTPSKRGGGGIVFVTLDESLAERDHQHDRPARARRRAREPGAPAPAAGGDGRLPLLRRARRRRDRGAARGVRGDDPARLARRQGVARQRDQRSGTRLMDSARWERVQALFHDAVDLPAAERERFLPCGVRRRSGADRRGAGTRSKKTSAASRCSTAAWRRPPAVSSATIPTRFEEIGPYRIVRVIGEGGMGVVFLAERTDLGSQAAIKILRDAWLSPARRQRFAIEQRTLAQPEPSVHRASLRRRRPVRRHAVDRDGVRRGRAAHRVLPARARTAAGAAAALPRRVRGGAVRASAPRDPSRPEAVEHPGHAGRAR